MNSIAKLYAQVVGVALVLPGILGFIGPLAPDSNLLGIFSINPLHNIIHLLSGVVALAAGFYAGGRYARLYAGVFGAVYALVTIIGFIQGSVLGLFTVNVPDNILHLGIAVTALGVFFLTGNRTATSAAPA